MTSWLTLNGDIRQKLTFKGNSCIFPCIFTKQCIKIYLFSQQDADHLVKDCQFGVSPVNYSDSDSDHMAGDRARTLMSRMETRASSLIFFSYL